MATLQRKICSRAIRHANAASKEHQEDVIINHQRKSLHWLAIEDAPTDTHRVIPALEEGLYIVRDHARFGQWKQLMDEFNAAVDHLVCEGPARTQAIVRLRDERRCKWETLGDAPDPGDMLLVSGDELVSRLDCWKSDLDHYYRYIADPKCTSGHRWKRTATVGIQGHVISASPWDSSTFFEMAEKDPEAAKDIALDMTHKLAVSYEQATKRRVISVQAHFDTQNLHFHLFSTRVGADHRFTKKSKSKFGLCGPWACGIRRQAQAGCIPADSTSYIHAMRNMQKAGSMPLDWMLCTVVDKACQAAFGSSPRFAHWLAIYKKGLVGICMDRIRRLHDASGKELALWEDHLVRGMDYRPKLGFGGRFAGGDIIEMGIDRSIN